MPTPFDEWTIEDAKIAVQLSKEQDAKLKSYRAFYEGDHWQDWDGWTGPRPVADDPDYAELSAEIERGFVSRGVIAEVINRHVNGVLGRDVKWSVTVRRKLKEDEQPTPDEQKLIDEATDLLTEWIEARKLNQEYDKAGQMLGYAGVAYQRLFVPPGELDGQGRVPVADMATNLGRIYQGFHLPGEATIYTDPRTQQKCGVLLYREVTSSRPSQSQNQEGEERAELTYLDGDQTVIRIVGGPETVDQEGNNVNRWKYNLGRRLIMSEMRRPPLINDQVVSQQKLLNKTLSMKSRNMDMAGFRERVTTNAQMGGSYQTIDGERVFVPHTLPVGPGSLTNLTGYILRDSDGKETLATPGMQWIDPVSVDSFLATEQSAYLAMLAETNQLHYAMSDDATASATSRETAMAAYLIDLLQTKQQTDAGWSYDLETALSLSAVLSNQPGRYDMLRVTAECSVDPGPISADMMRIVIDLVREALLSKKTGLGWIGVEDVDGELKLIETEQAEQAALFPETQPEEQEFGQDLEREIESLEQ